MKKIVAVVLTSLALASPLAFAQSKVDAETLAAANELLEATNARQMFQQTMEAMTAQLPAAMMQSAKATIDADTRTTPEQKKQALAKVEQMIPSMTETVRATLMVPEVYDEMLAQMPALYARHFTAHELREMAGFYQTPVGKKTLQVMPQLVAESMQLGQEAVARRMEQLMARLQALMQADAKRAK